jgi:U-box domain
VKSVQSRTKTKQEENGKRNSGAAATTTMTKKDDKEDEEPEIELPAGDGTKFNENKGHEDQEIDSEELVTEPTILPSTTPPSSPRPEQEEHDNSQCRFPWPFYDPTTKQLMKDPVVDPEGHSIENPVASGSATAQSTPVVIYYPNRVLKTIIQREVELKCPSFVGSLRRLDDAVWQSWNKLVDKSVIGSGDRDTKSLPEGFYCPITVELMADPVISPNGHTFERKAIERWVRANGTNPISRDALALKSLRRNNNLYELIQRETSKMESARHPSIRRWKDTTDQTSRPDDDVHYDDEEETPNATAGPHNNMPVSHDDTAAMRRQRNSQSRSIFLVLIFTLLVVTGVIPFSTAFILLFWTIVICVCLSAAQDSAARNNANQTSQGS